MSLAFIVLYALAKPYEDGVADSLQLWCQIAIFVNFFCGLLYMVRSDGVEDEHFTQILLMMNVLPLLLTVSVSSSSFAGVAMLG